MICHSHMVTYMIWLDIKPEFVRGNFFRDRSRLTNFRFLSRVFQRLLDVFLFFDSVKNNVEFKLGIIYIKSEIKIYDELWIIQFFSNERGCVELVNVSNHCPRPINFRVKVNNTVSVKEENVKVVVVITSEPYTKLIKPRLKFYQVQWLTHQNWYGESNLKH